MLSWYNIFLLILYPFASRKYLFHSIYGIALSAQMSSDSVELFVFSFGFFDILTINPRPFLPIDIVPPVCPRMLSWAAYDTSNHYFISVTTSAHRISGNFIFRFRYPIILLSFFQSSSSGFLAIVLRKAIAVYASLLHMIPSNNRFVTTRSNACSPCLVK